MLSSWTVNIVHLFFSFFALQEAFAMKYGKIMPLLGGKRDPPGGGFRKQQSTPHH